MWLKIFQHLFVLLRVKDKVILGLYHVLGNPAHLEFTAMNNCTTPEGVTIENRLCCNISPPLPPFISLDFPFYYFSFHLFCLVPSTYLLVLKLAKYFSQPLPCCSLCFLFRAMHGFFHAFNRFWCKSVVSVNSYSALFKNEQESCFLWTLISFLLYIFIALNPMCACSVALDMSDSAVPETIACQAPLSIGLPRREYWVGSHSLLQRSFPTQGLNPCILHCRRILYPLCHLGSSLNPMHIT